MSPSPTSNHQRILNKINVAIYNYFEKSRKGEVFVAPLDVYLDEVSNAVQPDIVVVLKENKHIIDDNGHIHGCPDLLIEILSPGNKEFDLVRKKGLYERFGIKEYWVVDPDTKACTGYGLKNNRFMTLGEFSGTIPSPLLELNIHL